MRPAERLPRRQREAVVLHHLVGLDEKQTAATMGVSANTVRTHLDRGMRALRASTAAVTEEFVDHVPD